MSIPDYISPIVGYRLWQWDDAGLKSLNGVRWIPGQPLVARCRASRWARRVGRPVAALENHDAPQTNCGCGVYASKSLDLLRSIRFWDCGIRGEAWLWGTVVEHKHGWRAQLAYPKTLCLPPEALPGTLGEIQLRLRALIAYRCDIFIVHDAENIPLWRKESGIDGAGLDFLMGRGKEWYARRKQRRTVNPGDRVAILGLGIAVVEHAGDRQVHLVLSNRTALRIGRTDIVWDEGNMRWEASTSHAFQTSFATNTKQTND